MAQRRLNQITNVVLMVRPSRFRCNEQTAVNNYFQIESAQDKDEVTGTAQAEFDNFTQTLRDRGITVVTVQDTDTFDTPDSVFPNNWISFHASKNDGTITANLYPMFAENRRCEKNLKELFISSLRSELGVTVEVNHDYSSFEDEGKFLEGTGSLILDRANAVAYCAQSPRAHPEILEKFCVDMGYTKMAFTAYQTVQKERVPIYHTNVMMCVAETFAVICLDSIDDLTERTRISESLVSNGKEIIEITEEQVGHFAGNMLQLHSGERSSVLVMSSEAYSVLTADQRACIEAHCPILHAPLPVIEGNGGGSARCMMAEVFV